MTFTVGKYTIFNAFAIACIYMYVHTYIHAYRHTLFDIMAYGPFIIDGTLGSFVGCCNSQSAPIATDCIQQTLPKVHYYCESGYWCACKPGQDGLCACQTLVVPYHTVNGTCGVASDSCWYSYKVLTTGYMYVCCNGNSNTIVYI